MKVHCFSLYIICLNFPMTLLYIFFPHVPRFLFMYVHMLILLQILGLESLIRKPNQDYFLNLSMTSSSAFMVSYISIQIFIPIGIYYARRYQLWIQTFSKRTTHLFQHHLLNYISCLHCFEMPPVSH